MPGAISPNFHEGSRSEYLAQYAFSSWGTAVPVPHQEDCGLDLYCTLVERIGQRAWAKSPYTVQVKSSIEPWVFEEREAVQWLVEHPLPLFLCVVQKRDLRICVYQTSPRFYVWGRGQLPERISLAPTTEPVGEPPRWADGENFSLGAPILDFTLQRFLDTDFPSLASRVIESWVMVDLANLHRMRCGVRRFVVPSRYSPNEECSTRTTMSFSKVTQPASDEELASALPSLQEMLTFVGGELFKRGDLRGAALSVLLHRHVFPGKLHPFLNEIDERLAVEKSNYRHVGIERMEQVFDEAMSASPSYFDSGPKCE